MVISWGLTVKFSQSSAVAAWSHCTSGEGTLQGFPLGSIQAKLPIPAWRHEEVLCSNPIAHVWADEEPAKGCGNWTGRVESEVFPCYPRKSCLEAGAWHRYMEVDRTSLPWKTFAKKRNKEWETKKSSGMRSANADWRCLQLVPPRALCGQHAFHVNNRIPKFNWSEEHLTVLH